MKIRFSDGKTPCFERLCVHSWCALHSPAEVAPASRDHHSTDLHHINIDATGAKGISHMVNFGKNLHIVFPSLASLSFILHSTSQYITKKSQNDRKNGQNGKKAQKVEKRSQNGWKRHQNVPKMIPKLHQNDPASTPKTVENHRKITLFCLKVVQRWLFIAPDGAKNCSNGGQKGITSGQKAFKSHVDLHISA